VSLNGTKVGVLLLSIFVIAICGIVYELIISTISSYLLGNSVWQFSVTIGLFMFGMGVGSLVTKYFSDEYLKNFLRVELLIAALGGMSGIILFLVFPYMRVVYETTMYVLILMIGMLVGMEIPILTTLLSSQQSAKKSIADVMSFDYIGALFGAIAFPLLLLPSLGLIQSSFVVGLINAFVALTNAYVFRDSVEGGDRYVAASWGVIVILLLGIIFGSQLTKFAEKHLYFDQVLFTKQSEYQNVVVTKNVTQGDIRLYLDGHIQFSTKDEYRYHEYLVHPAFLMGNPIKSVLILGGGEGLALREVYKHTQIEHVDIVDLDPSITELGRTNAIFRRINEDSLLDRRTHIINDDAFNFVRNPPRKYDRVIIDLPDPHNEALNKLYSREFYKFVSRLLNPGGIVTTQSTSPFFAPRTYWAIESTLKSVFDQTLSYNVHLPSFGIWGFHMGSNDSLLQSEIEVNVVTRSLTSEGFVKSQIFEKDIQKIVGLPVNTIVEPTLYDLYIRDLSNQTRREVLN
jgi:spermidine synthase